METLAIGPLHGVRLFLSAQRRLVAVLAVDVVDDGRLTEAHEDDTQLVRLRSGILDPGVLRHGGRVIKNTGNGFLAMFDSAREATACALDLQRSVIAKSAEQAPDRRISFRMAVNIANAIVERDDIYGDGVNVAARLPAYAEPGGVVVSGAVAEQIGTSLDVGATEVGELILRLHARPVRVYSLQVQAFPPRRVGEADACEARHLRN